LHQPWIRNNLKQQTKISGIEEGKEHKNKKVWDRYNHLKRETVIDTKQTAYH